MPSLCDASAGLAAAYVAVALAGVAAVLGVVKGLVVDPFIVLAPALAGAILGYLQGGPAALAVRRWIGRTVIGVLSAAFFLAFVVLVRMGLSTDSPIILPQIFLPVTAAGGLAVGLPVLPGALFLVVTARLRLRSRPGTPVGRAHRRALLPAAAAMVAVEALVLHDWAAALAYVGRVLAGERAMPASADARSALAFAIAGSASLVVLLATVADLAALRRLGLRLGSLGALRPSGADAIRRDVPAFDVGVGEGWREAIRAPEAPYREAERVVGAVRGDPSLALDELRRRVVMDVVLFAASQLATAALFVPLVLATR